MYTLTTCQSVYLYVQGVCLYQYKHIVRILIQFLAGLVKSYSANCFHTHYYKGRNLMNLKIRCKYSFTIKCNLRFTRLIWRLYNELLIYFDIWTFSSYFQYPVTLSACSSDWLTAPTTKSQSLKGTWATCHIFLMRRLSPHSLVNLSSY